MCLHSLQLTHAFLYSYIHTGVLTKTDIRNKQIKKIFNSLVNSFIVCESFLRSHAEKWIPGKTLELSRVVKDMQEEHYNRRTVSSSACVIVHVWMVNVVLNSTTILISHTKYNLWCLHWKNSHPLPSTHHIHGKHIQMTRSHSPNT